MRTLLRWLAVFVAYVCLTCSAEAQVRLGEPFGDHMVLPRNVPVVIWGTGCPGGDTVRLSLAGQSVTGFSDWEGRWKVTLAPMRAGGPYQMNIQIGGTGRLIPSSAANDHGGAEINDVLIGELVVIPGASAAAIAPVAKATHPYAEVRVFAAGHPVDSAFASNRTRQWFYVAQDTVPLSTAAAFAAGRSVQERLHVPVGIIVSTNGPLAPSQTSQETPRK